MTREKANRQLIDLFTGKQWDGPSFSATTDLSEDDAFRLQTMLANGKLRWLTGIGIMDAIDLLVDEAINNSVQAFEAAP